MYMTEDGVPVVYVEGVGWVNAQEGSDGQLYCVYDEAAPAEDMGQSDTGSDGVIVGEREPDGTVGQEEAGLPREAERGQAPTEEEGGVEPVAVQNAPETKLTTTDDAVSHIEKRASIMYSINYACLMRLHTIATLVGEGGEAEVGAGGGC